MRSAGRDSDAAVRVPATRTGGGARRDWEKGGGGGWDGWVGAGEPEPGRPGTEGRKLEGPVTQSEGEMQASSDLSRSH